MLEKEREERIEENMQTKEMGSHSKILMIVKKKKQS